MSCREELKRQRKEEYRYLAVMPCRLRILPQYVFRDRDPIVIGVNVEDGFVTVGTPLCVVKDVSADSAESGGGTKHPSNPNKEVGVLDHRVIY